MLAVYPPTVRVKSIISGTRVPPAVWPRAIFALWAIREIYGGGGEPNKGETGTGVDGDVLYLSVEKSRQQSGLGSSRNCHTQQSHRGFGIGAFPASMFPAARPGDKTRAVGACARVRNYARGTDPHVSRLAERGPPVLFVQLSTASYRFAVYELTRSVPSLLSA
ncbi:hypothetical protein K0M31_005030 [Melipona bicolor]|uniref:Uncharacterized protein n=1 Tax=Melipona bicolor TaxID=60889 RepID=A0AA40FW08_9HYME|nr:hypothetical protein K0M31_005030 [Melipona bicolor]